MSGRDRLLIWLMAACALLFAAGVWHLFLVRFETGDVFPPYSSLSADPVGTRGLFESIGMLSHVSVQRNFRGVDKVVLGPEVTVLFCGQEPGSVFLGGPWKRLMENLRTHGGRLVVAMVGTLSGIPHGQGQEGESTAPSHKCAPSPCEDEPASPPSQEGEDREKPWNAQEALGIRWVGAPMQAPLPRALRTAPADPRLPPTLPWHSPVRFRLDAPSWQALYTWAGLPVLVTRSWGKGTLIMAGDSYLLSNEALRKDRHTALLAWLASGRTVVFDESHLGLREQPGMASLVRKYRLQGAGALLVLVAVLFIWRQAVGTVSRSSSPQEGPAPSQAATRNTHEGLVNLMHRHIPVDKLLTVCTAAWQSGAATNGLPPATVAKVKTMVEEAAGGHADPVPIYRQICDTLHRTERS